MIDVVIWLARAGLAGSRVSVSTGIAGMPSKPNPGCLCQSCCNEMVMWPGVRCSIGCTT